MSIYNFGYIPFWFRGRDFGSVCTSSWSMLTILLLIRCFMYMTADNCIAYRLTKQGCTVLRLSGCFLGTTESYGGKNLYRKPLVPREYTLNYTYVEKNQILAYKFLAHLSRRLKGELIVYQSGRRLSVCLCVWLYVCGHFQTRISPQPVDQS